MSSPFRGECLAGKVALITGGGSGIGLEIATQLGLHGACVGIMGRREKVLGLAVQQLQGQGVKAVCCAGDVRRKEDADAAVQSVLAAFGRLDILINGAAGNFLASAEDLSSNAFRTVLDIDSVGTFTMSLAARPYLQRGGPGKTEQEGGAIVNISATLHYTAAWYQAHVIAAKAAVDATTRALALEWGYECGIRCNTVAPGPIADTPGMAKLAPSDLGLDTNQYIPLGRMGTPKDIALAVLYLVSDAGSFVNGANLVVDGGGWLYRPRIVDKDVVRAVSRQVEKRSRQTGLPSGRSKL